MKGGFEPATLEFQVEHSTTKLKPLSNAELRELFCAHSLPLFQLLRRDEYRASAGVRVTKHTHRDERPGSHARRYRDDEVAGCVQEVSARRLSPREADSSRRTGAASSSSVGSHGRVLAPITIAAPFIGNSASRDGISPSLFSTYLPCYNWRPKRVGTRTPSTTSVQGNPDSLWSNRDREFR